MYTRNPQNKMARFIIRGMQRDLSAARFSPEFSYTNMNLRIAPIKNSTMMSLTNEKGTLYSSVYGIGDLEYEKKLRDWYNSISTHDIYKDKFFGEDKTNSSSSIIDGLDDLLIVNKQEGVIQSSIKEDKEKVEKPEVGFGDILGIPIGKALLNNELTIFTTEYEDDFDIDVEEKVIEDFEIGENKIIEDFAIPNNTDRIYKFWLNGSQLCGKLLYKGHLNFDYRNPIETITFYENSDIRKVYWLDKHNQPRFINIAADDNEIASWNNQSFDFVRTLELREEVKIEKQLSGGLFPTGCIQYMFTYYNMFGAESNVFYQTPLYYTSYNDRGCSPEETTSNSFTISIKNLDINFDYVRIYSIYRTSIDNVPTVKRVADIPIPLDKDNNGTYSISYTDTGTNGSIVDPTELFYVGGELLAAYTFAQKDNTLFLGNVNLKRMYVSKEVRDSIRSYAMNRKSSDDDFKKGYINNTDTTKFKFYNDYIGKSSPEFNELIHNVDMYNRGGGNIKYLPYNSYTKYFKKGEIYRFGLQFQHYTGKWSDVVWIGDYKNNVGVSTNSYDPYKPNPNTDEPGTAINMAAKGVLDLSGDSVDIRSLISLGYRRVRPVVVYPTINERLVIAQGVLNNTLFSLDKRYKGLRHSQADYYFRPYVSNSEFTDNGQYRYREFRHLARIRGVSQNNSTGSDIIDRVSGAEIETENYEWYSKELKYLNNDAYGNRDIPFIDRSIVTFNSPELEFDTDIQHIDLSQINLRIVGIINNINCYSDMDIITTNVPNAWFKEIDSGESTNTDVIRSRYIPNGYYSRIKKRTYSSQFRQSWFAWIDEMEDLPTYTDKEGIEKINVYSAYRVSQTFKSWLVCPWQQTGSLNNSKTSTKSDVSSKLKNKKVSNLITSRTVFFYNTKGLNNYTWAVKPKDLKLWTSEQNEMIKIDGDIYQANIDDLILTSTADGSKYSKMYKAINKNGVKDSIYLIDTLVYGGNNTNIHRVVDGVNKNNVDNVDKDTEDVITLSYEHDNPISMKYKSNIHAVIKLPEVHNANSVMPSSPSHRTFSESDMKITDTVNIGSAVKNYSYFCTDIEIGDLSDSYLYLGELYRDESSIKNRFGGITDEALQANKFTVCGEPVDIYKYDYDNKNEIIRDQDGSPVLRCADSIVVNFTEGDMFFQNYQCLKTYPFTLDDENSMVEILNFDVETRINLAGRYDRNQYQWSNLVALPSNFNLVNNVYSQKNNFMSYSQQDLLRTGINEFPNTITWTKTKTAGEDIDQWTNLTMASTLDLDGDKGQINKLIRLNDQLISFQDTGISQILYNEQMQMSTTEGVPIEIANSGKVTGKRYVSEHIGCVNKWSIAISNKSCYFVDDINKGIYSFSQEGLNSLSNNLGFHSWINKESTSLLPWNPVSFGNIVSYYDNKNEDVLFINKRECLAFSEQLGQFSSFYNYEETPYYSRIEDRALFLSDQTDKGHNKKYKFWFQHEGDYNMFFDQYRPFYLTVVVNPEDGTDKVFNNVEFRSDTWTKENELIEDTFDTIYAWNEYQHNRETLLYNQGMVSNLKKKFRIWYANIPRDYKNKLDRMRNPWIYLKLAMNQVNTNKTILHDMNVYYYG